MEMAITSCSRFSIHTENDYSYSQLASYPAKIFQILIPFFVFRVCLLQPAAIRAAKLLIAGQEVLELASLANQLATFYLSMFVSRASQMQTGVLRTFFFEKNPLDFLDYLLNPWEFQRQFHPWKFHMHKITLHPAIQLVLEFSRPNTNDQDPMEIP